MPFLGLGRLALGLSRIGGKAARAVNPEARKTRKLAGLKKRNAKRERIAGLNAAIKAERAKGRRK